VDKYNDQKGLLHRNQEKPSRICTVFTTVFTSIGITVAILVLMAVWEASGT
jgi:hypothetical protein